MRRLTVPATAAIILITTQLLLAQTRMKPTAPGTPGDPVWQGVLHLSDGRTFVTDGGLAIDAAIAKPAKLPEREVPGKVLENYINLSHKHECGLSDLKAAASGLTYTAPNGMALNATYIDFLRRTLSAGAVRLRMTEELQPITIVANGKPVGVLMAVKQ